MILDKFIMEFFVHALTPSISGGAQRRPLHAVVRQRRHEVRDLIQFEIRSSTEGAMVSSISSYSDIAPVFAV